MGFSGLLVASCGVVAALTNERVQFGVRTMRSGDLAYIARHVTALAYGG